MEVKLLRGVVVVWMPVQDMQDIERAKSFYKDTLGLQFTNEDGEWAEVEQQSKTARETISSSTGHRAVNEVSHGLRRSYLRKLCLPLYSIVATVIGNVEARGFESGALDAGGLKLLPKCLHTPVSSSTEAE